MADPAPRMEAEPTPQHWCWMAEVDAMPADAYAAARLRTLAGEPAGVLAAWRGRAKPVRHALRADARVFDPHGAAATVSLVLAPPGVQLPFDDLSVQEARRRVLAAQPPAAVSTLLRDAVNFAGAITAYRRGPTRSCDEDPFARIFPARRLAAGSGLIGAPLPAAGPTIERYGSTEPWPWDRFAG